VDGTAGVILISRAGGIGLHCNTERMARAWIDVDGVEWTAFARGTMGP
jgi:isoaspartyl peptidase/L-asparaginase-like protein (Ntn-hydrolase superfamily)